MNIKYLFLCHIHAHNTPTGADELTEYEAVYPSTRAEIQNAATFHCFRVNCTTTIVPVKLVNNNQLNDDL